MESQYSFTKSNRLLMYSQRNKDFWKFQFLRWLSFLIDLIVVIALEVLMSTLFNGFFNNFMLISILGVFYLMLSNLLCLMIFDGQTLGMKITKIKAIHKSGFKTTKISLIIRSFFSGLYAMPIIGWSMMLTSGLAIVVFKGMSMVDMLSQTCIVTNQTYWDLNKLEKEFIEENTGGEYE